MKKSTISAVAAVSLIGCVALGIGIVSDGYRNWDTSTWFGRGGGSDVVQPENPDPPDTSDDLTDSLIVKPDGGQMRFTAVPKRASADETARVAAQTVTVVSPVKNYTYEWSLHFVTGEADATEYITLSATAGTSIDVSVKQPFGTKIRLICTAKVGDKTLSSGECSLGYYKRVEKAYIGFASTQPNTVLSNGAGYYANGQAYDLSGWNGRHIGHVMMASAFSFVSSNNARFELSVGTDTRNEYTALAMTVTETQSGKSFVVSTPSISFSEFYYRWTCVMSGKDYVQSEYEQAKTNWENMFNYGGAAVCNMFYYGYGGITGIAGKTFEFRPVGMTSSGVEPVGDITVSFTVPASAWEVPTQTTLDKDNIIF